MPNEERGRLDSAIDRAVRGMMQVDPPPGLRHRVADRIEAGARRSWFVPAFAALAASVLLIVAAALVRTQQPTAVPEQPVASATPSAPSEKPPEPPATAPQPQSPASQPGESVPSTVRRPKGSGESIFGEKSGRVSATSVRREGQHQRKATGPANIRLDLTFLEQTGAGEPVREVISMVVADGDAGTSRRGGNAGTQGRAQINVDARPELLESGAIRLTLALDYKAGVASNTVPAQGSTLIEQITTVVQPGKPAVVAQTADSDANRKITVEVKASLVK